MLPPPETYQEGQNEPCFRIEMSASCQSHQAIILTNRLPVNAALGPSSDYSHTRIVTCAACNLEGVLLTSSDRQITQHQACKDESVRLSVSPTALRTTAISEHILDSGKTAG